MRRTLAGGFRAQRASIVKSYSSTRNVGNRTLHTGFIFKRNRQEFRSALDVQILWITVVLRCIRRYGFLLEGGFSNIFVGMFGSVQCNYVLTKYSNLSMIMFAVIKIYCKRISASVEIVIVIIHTYAVYLILKTTSKSQSIIVFREIKVWFLLSLYHYRTICSIVYHWIAL